MFEDNINDMKQDQLFRSILDEGTEPAPAHVWDRIEADLDRIDRRRTVMLWFRRTAVGAAAAAAVAFGLFFGNEGHEDMVSPVAGSGMIAVVEQEKPAADLVAEVQDVPQMTVARPVQMEKQETAGHIARQETAAEQMQTENEEPAEHDGLTEHEEQTGKPAGTEKKQQEFKPEGTFRDFWPEERTSVRKRRTSLTVSGITGTNSAQNSARVNPIRRPGISAAPRKTGIKETSTNTTYGIPMSVGAGIKVDLAPRWSIGAGLNYTLLTRRFYGTYTSVGENGSILKDVSSDVRNSQHYVGIPVNVYYDIIDRENIRFYAYAGGTADKCIADKYHMLGTDITHTEKVKGMQFSANLGLGAEFIATDHIGIYLDPNLKYYFDNNQPKSIRTAKPLMFGFEVGLRFHL